jgi:hypothetical protein
MASVPRSRSYPTRTRTPYPTGRLIGLGALVVTTATIGALMVPATHSGWRLGVVAAAAGVFAALALDGAAVAVTGGLAWLLVTGLLVARSGELARHGPADVHRSLTIIAATAIGLTLGHAIRMWLAPRRHRLFDGEWHTVDRGA